MNRKSGFLLLLGLSAGCAGEQVTDPPLPPPPLPIIVTVSPTGVTINVGGSLQLVAAANVPVTGWGWAVSDPSRAEVSSDGLVTGIAVGPVAVTACALNRTDACGSVSLTISGIVSGGAPSVTVTPAQDSLTVGETLQVSVTGSMSGPPWIWTMLEETIASVSSTGLVTAKRAGVTVLRVCATGPLSSVCGAAGITVQ